MPFFLMVRIPRVETSILIDLFNSGTKIFFFCRFGYFRTLPVGLNLVARVLFEYPPPIIPLFFDIAHIFTMIFSCYHR